MMSNKIVIDNPVVEGKTIRYSFSASGDWKKVFLHDHFSIEYSVDCGQLPHSIAIVPLLANILPVSWIYDAEIIAPSCDRDFYENTPEIKNGYMQMYPSISFKGSLKVDKIEENSIVVQDDQSAAVSFFSGGVDAFSTLFSHRDEHPTLITLWGADVFLDDTAGWQRMEEHLRRTAEEYHTNYVTVKSEFRQFLSTEVLTERVKDTGEGWWHGFQHGIAIIAHAAPVVYLLGKKVVYFASSYSVHDPVKIKCASHPTIDNYCCFAGAKTIHDGFEFTRQMKIQRIVEFARENGEKVNLRVCWSAAGGKNCC